MMFDVIHLSKQCRSEYINTMRCLPTKSCACLAYYDKQTTLNLLFVGVGSIGSFEDTV